MQPLKPYKNQRVTEGSVWGCPGGGGGMHSYTAMWVFGTFAWGIIYLHLPDCPL